MTVRLSTDLWRQVLCPRFLSVPDVVRMSSVDRFFRALLSDAGMWRSVVLRHSRPFPLARLGEHDWKGLVSSCFPNLSLLSRHVALLNLAALSALPPSRPEAVSFFLYIHWAGAALSSSTRMVRFGSRVLGVALAAGTLVLHASAEADLPLVCYGWQGIVSRVELVMVSRRVQGNRKVLTAWDQLGPVRSGFGGEGDGLPGDVNVNVASPRSAEGCTLRLFVSTPSRSQYAMLGKFAFDNESYFFDLGSARSAGIGHAEAKNFQYSTEGLDRRLRESTAGIPFVPAGGAREFYVTCPIEFLAREALQLKEEPVEEDI